MHTALKTIILGGYGNFGARIAWRLSGDPRIALVITGRSLAKAQSFAQTLDHFASAAWLDINHPNFKSALRALKPHLVIHTAGPFQRQDYSIPTAVAEAGAHYIDLADGREFVCEFPNAMHDIFAKVGKIGISGASTVPALSSAVVNALSADISSIDTIDICIAPAQQAPRGLATMKAVLGYCGEAIPILSNGAWTTGYGWSDLTKISFARMSARQGALCDIPDLALFPQRYAGVKTVIFRASLELGIAQRMFAALAYLRRKKLLPRLDKFAYAIHLLAKPFDKLGSQLGGMVVKIEGLDASGKAIRREWHITADNNHGPEIPCIAAILLARKLAANTIELTGAYCCMDFLSLADFEPEFSAWHMQTDLLTAAGERPALQ